MPIFVTRFCKVHDHSLRFLLLGLSLGVSSFLYPQSNITDLSFYENYGIPNIQSPNAADLGKYGDIPVSLYTGRANISIPLYTLSCRGFQMPISLDYDTSGLLMNTLPGWTGHNWTLNVGGVITRRVQGMYDERMHIQNDFESGFLQSYSIIKDLIEGNYNTNADAGYDIAPDEFTFNVMGLSGRFFLGNDGQWKVYSDDNVEVIFDIANIASPDNENLIYPFVDYFPNRSTRQPKCIKGFKLRDENGTIYEFGGDDSSIDFSLGFDHSNNSYDDYKNHPWLANCWYLTKVTDKYGNILYTFEYERGAYIAHLFNSLEISGAVQDNSSYSMRLGNCFLDVNNQMFPYSGELISPVYLKRISAANGVNIDFKTSYQPTSLDSLYQDGLFQERFHDKLEQDRLNTNGIPNTSSEPVGYVGNGITTYAYYYLQAYDALSVYQYNSGLSPRERYMNPLRQSRIKQLDSISIVSDIEQLCFALDYNFKNRMHLTKIKVIDPSTPSNLAYSYSFVYNHYDKVPSDYLTRQSDHWGYALSKPYSIGDSYFYNTTLPGEAIETGTRSSPFVSDLLISTDLINGDASNEVDFISNRSSDSIASQYGALKKIIYPTGGETRIEYENNDFSKYMSNDRQNAIDTIVVRLVPKDVPLEPLESLEEIQCDTIYSDPLCGGLRVKCIEEYDGNTLLRRKTFRYIDPSTGRSSGQLFSLPRYSWNWSLITPRYEPYIYASTRRNSSILPLSNSFGPHVGYSYVDVIEEKGHSLHHFQNIADCKDEPALVYFRPTDCTSPYDRYSEHGYGRGKLLDVRTFDENDQPVKTSIFQYDTLNLDKYFVYTSNLLNGCLKRNGNAIGDGAPLFGCYYKLYYPKYKLAIQTDSIKNGNTWDVTQTRYVYKKDTIHLSTPYTHWVDICKTEKESVFHGNDSTSISYHYTFEPAVSLSLARKYHDLTPYKVEYEHNNSTYRSDSFQYQLINSHIVPSALISKKTNQAEDTLVTYNEYTETYALKRFTKLGEQPTQVYWNPTQTAVVGMIKGPSNLLDSLTVTDWHQLRQGNPLLHVYSYTYDSLGNIVSITSPNGNTEYFDYQWGNFLTGKRNALQQQTDQYIYHYATEGAN